jgi:hypothetical protein
MISIITPLSQFKAAYEGLDKAIKGSEINRIYQMKLEADTGIQKVLIDLNEKEVEILSEQLRELKRNGEYLRIIASSTHNKGDNSFSLNGNNFDKSNATISNFTTKDSYINHLNLTTSSLEL